LGRSVVSLPPILRQNPYQRLLYEHLEPHGVRYVGSGELELGWLIRRRSKVAVLHFHWPENYYYWLGHPVRARVPLSWLRVLLFAVRLGAARLLGYRIVWTVHQVRPHESLGRRLDRTAAWLLAHASAAVLAHDASTARQVERDARLPPGRVAVVPHGSYVGVYPTGRDRPAVRRELDIPDDAVVLLSFGHLRGYKEATALVEAFDALDDPAVYLVVAGLPLDAAAREDVARAAAANTRIRVVLEFVPDEQVSELFGACDVCVFARRDGGTSGALVLALSLGVPVVAADVPAYRELLGDERAGWLFDAAAEGGLEASLRRAAGDREGIAVKAKAASAVADDLAWPVLAPRYAAVIGDVGEPAAR
jgi:glycosyltransferase involved in cell wall biosynthesis